MRYGIMKQNDFYRPHGLFEELDYSFGQLLGKTQGVQPTVDFSEGEHEFHLSMDLPGMGREDVGIEMKGGVLRVSGERKSSRQEGGFTERSYGSFERSFKLPDSADGDKVGATFEHGVLDLTIAKREDIRPKKIEIK